MSNYQKAHEVYADYNQATTRPDQAAGYAPFAPAGFDASYMGTHAQVPSGLPSAEQPMLAADPYASHDDSYSAQGTTYSSFIAAPSRHFPEITSFSPSSGPGGRKLFVHLNSSVDLAANPAQYCTVLFGGRRCSTMLSRFDDPSQQSNYFLTVDVPPFDSTSSPATSVALSLEMNDGAANSVVRVPFGQYSYTDATAYDMSSPSPHSSRKRKLSMSAEGPSPGKRSSTQQLRAGDFDSSHTSPQTSSALSPFSQAQQTPNYAYTQTPLRSQYQAMSQSSTPRYGVSPQTTASHLSISQQHPQAAVYSTFGGYMTDRSSAPPTQAMMAQSQISNGGANPPLIRTSALQSDPSSSPHSLSAAAFNPYAMYPSNSKAILKLESDLNTMAEHWTTEEVQTQRRLVRFRRSQNGSTITASFEPVTPEDHARAPGNIYVNCIWWKEKQACFITSVDTIQLLESLVAVRFTVEEKNRIRRNLEGFRPLTVSKTRPECEEFFKTIMGFPSPKPRNIEKDVKVFPWRILGHALKKIIGKYSASYSSTAAALPPSMGSASTCGSSNERPTVSPPSAGNSSSAALQYGGGMPANTMSQHIGGTMGMAGSSEPPVSLPQGSGMGQSMSWHQPSTNYTTDLPSQRPSWDFSSFQVENGAASATAGQSGPMHYNRIPSISQSLGFNNYYIPGQDYQRTTQA